MALGSALGWAGSFFTNQQAARDAAQVRAEVRNSERERAADAAARQRNCKNRQAIESLLKLSDQGKAAVGTSGPDDGDSSMEFYSFLLRIRARFSDDPSILDPVVKLAKNRATTIELFQAGDGSYKSVGPEIETEWSRLFHERLDLKQELADEMHRRDWPW